MGRSQFGASERGCTAARVRPERGCLAPLTRALAPVPPSTRHGQGYPQCQKMKFVTRFRMLCAHLSFEPRLYAVINPSEVASCLLPAFLFSFIR